MAYLKNWTDNFFQIFFMGTSWVAVSIKNIKTRASSEMTSRKNIKIFDFNGVNVAKHWHVAGRGICHLWLPCCICFDLTCLVISYMRFDLTCYFLCVFSLVLLFLVCVFTCLVISCVCFDLSCYFLYAFWLVLLFLVCVLLALLFLVCVLFWSVSLAWFVQISVYRLHLPPQSLQHTNRLHILLDVLSALVHVPTISKLLG